MSTFLLIILDPKICTTVQLNFAQTFDIPIKSGFVTPWLLQRTMIMQRQYLNKDFDPYNCIP